MLPLLQKFLLVTIALVAGLKKNMYAQSQFRCAETTAQDVTWQCIGPNHVEAQIRHQHFGVVTTIAGNPMRDSLEIYAGTMRGGLWYTADGGAHWKCLTDYYKNAVCGITSMHIDFSKPKHKIILATGALLDYTDVPLSGVIYSDDGGATFKESIWDDDFFNKGFYDIITKISVSEDGNLIFCSTSTAIFRSDDGAKHFKKIFPVSKEHMRNCERIKNFSSLYYAASSDKLYFSIPYVGYNDSVDNTFKVQEANLWQLNNASGAIDEMELVNLKSYLLNKKITKKEGSYSQIQIIPLANNQFKFTFFSEKATENYYCFYYDPSNKEVTKQMPSNLGSGGFDITHYAGERINKVNPSVQYLGTHILSKSLDSGKNFISKYGYGFGDNNEPHADLRCMEITYSSKDGATDHLLLGTDGGISFSNDGGQTYRNMNGLNFPITECYGLAVSPFDGEMMIGTQDNSIIKYIADKKQWRWNISGDGYDVEASKINPMQWFGSYNFGELFQCIDDGIPLRRRTAVGRPDGTNNIRFLRSMGSGNIYLSGIKYIYKLDTKGKLSLSSTTNMQHKITGFDVCESNENVQVIVNLWPLPGSSMKRTTDGGKTWTDIGDLVKVAGNHPNSIFGYKVNDVCINPYNEDEMWISLGYYGNWSKICDGYNRVWYSKDGGQTWTDYSEGLSAHGVGDILFVPGTKKALFAATNVGIYFRESTTDIWRYYGKGLPQCVTNEIAFDFTNNTLVAATMGRGVWRVPLVGITYNNPLIIDADTTIGFSDSNHTYFMNRDILIAKGKTLKVQNKLFLKSGARIIATNSSQLQWKTTGKIMYNDGQLFSDVTVQQKKRKRFFGFLN